MVCLQEGVQLVNNSQAAANDTNNGQMSGGDACQRADSSKRTGRKKENQTSTRCRKFTWRSQSVMFVFDSRSPCFLGCRPARAHESHGKVCRRRRHFLIHGKHVHSHTRCCNLANQTECFRNHLDLSCAYIWLTGQRAFSEKGRQNLEDDGTDHLCIAFSYRSDFTYLFIFWLSRRQEAGVEC